MLLVRRDVVARYKQTVFGVAWAVLQPVAAMLVFSLLFGRWGGMPSSDRAYPVFVFTALVPWTFFVTAVTQASNSLVSNANLVTKVYFPRLLLPAATVFAGLVDLAIGFVLLVGMASLYGHGPAWAILTAPVLVAFTILAAFGAGAFLATLNVRYRDVRHAVPFGLQLWLFLTPVVYPLEMIPEPWRWVAALNPMAGLIHAYRAVVLSTPVDLALVGVSCTVAIVLCVVGVTYLTRTERVLADVV